MPPKHAAHAVSAVDARGGHGPEPFTIPASALVPGENRLCFRFSRALPGEEGTRVAAAVSVIQLP
jgi:hypothetical protein